MVTQGGKPRGYGCVLGVVRSGLMEEQDGG
jgi:hypothetical protein